MILLSETHRNFYPSQVPELLLHQLYRGTLFSQEILAFGAMMISFNFPSTSIQVEATFPKESVPISLSLFSNKNSCSSMVEPQFGAWKPKARGHSVHAWWIYRAHSYGRWSSESQDKPHRSGRLVHLSPLLGAQCGSKQNNGTQGLARPLYHYLCQFLHPEFKTES